MYTCFHPAATAVFAVCTLPTLYFSVLCFLRRGRDLVGAEPGDENIWRFWPKPHPEEE